MTRKEYDTMHTEEKIRIATLDNIEQSIRLLSDARQSLVDAILESGGKLTSEEPTLKMFDNLHYSLENLSKVFVSYKPFNFAEFCEMSAFAEEDMKKEQ